MTISAVSVGREAEMRSIARHAFVALSLLPMAGVSGCVAADARVASASPAGQGTAHPDLWPAAKSRGLVDPETEARISALLARMSVEEKVGQMIQADTSAIRPEDLRAYPLGSILAGGSSPPVGAPD